jgi:hypothetical protein
MEALPELKCQRILYIVLIGEEYITVADEIRRKLTLVPGSAFAGPERYHDLSPQNSAGFGKI